MQWFKKQLWWQWPLVCPVTPWKSPSAVGCFCNSSSLPHGCSLKALGQLGEEFGFIPWAWVMEGCPSSSPGRVSVFEPCPIHVWVHELSS